TAQEAQRRRGRRLPPVARPGDRARASAAHDRARGDGGRRAHAAPGDDRARARPGDRGRVGCLVDYRAPFLSLAHPRRGLTPTGIRPLRQRPGGRQGLAQGPRQKLRLSEATSAHPAAISQSLNRGDFELFRMDATTETTSAITPEIVAEHGLTPEEYA